MRAHTRTAFLQAISALSSPLTARKGIIAVDYGTKKIGLAVAPSLKHAAAPLATILLPPPFQSRPLIAQSAVDALKAHIEAHRAGALVVGWPLDPNGHRTVECDRTDAFVQQLRGSSVFVPIVLWDERGSTAAARATLREASPLSRAGTSARKHVVPHELRGRLDELAAVNILQSFLLKARQALGENADDAATARD